MNPFDIAIPELDEGFRYLKRPLADGMRASVACDCASCAIIQYLNPNDDRVFDAFREGVAFMGHLLHQAWAYGVFKGEQYECEAAIPWKHGVSHDDVIVRTGDWAGVYEVKTHSDPKPKAPSAANHRQAEFRLRLRELAGLEQPGPMRLVMIGKAGAESGMVRGPWEVLLDDERRAEIDETLALIDHAVADAASLDLHGDTLKALSNGCTRCFPKPVVHINSADALVGLYLRLKREDAELDANRKDIVEQRKPLKERLEQVRAQLDEVVPDGVIVEAMSGTASRTRAGALVIKEHAAA